MEQFFEFFLVVSVWLGVRQSFLISEAVQFQTIFRLCYFCSFWYVNNFALGRNLENVCLQNPSPKWVKKKVQKRRAKSCNWPVWFHILGVHPKMSSNPNPQKQEQMMRRSSTRLGRYETVAFPCQVGRRRCSEPGNRNLGCPPEMGCRVEHLVLVTGWWPRATRRVL